MIIAKNTLLHAMYAKGYNFLRLSKEMEKNREHLTGVIKGDRATSAPYAKEICEKLGVEFDKVFEVK